MAKDLRFVFSWLVCVLQITETTIERVSRQDIKTLGTIRGILMPDGTLISVFDIPTQTI